MLQHTHLFLRLTHLITLIIISFWYILCKHFSIVSCFFIYLFPYYITYFRQIPPFSLIYYSFFTKILIIKAHQINPPYPICLIIIYPLSHYHLIINFNFPVNHYFIYTVWNLPFISVCYNDNKGFFMTLILHKCFFRRIIDT